ncbi:hypothetical protein FVEN_g11744 [Fusarium venenatum]|uniref:Uncharacterized protein n=1 Tax=Fusarium venenatum TaxID=56646 RepID=A0A2L2TA59_9HYPO|nr:uncharacterized protein FVRRES_13809 [Fusarium venenatum]KAG8350079.1 hypothetical protein FVEN_g11744 [Fusarium venenatum]CEI41928.1 unnamed protein product [Fusarium venenatum]
MVPRPDASALRVTCYRAIGTVRDAQTVVSECINGRWNLVPRGPNDSEAMQLTRYDAVFVFEVKGQCPDPTERLEASEPKFDITTISSNARVDLKRKSITITVDGRKYGVVVIYRSQSLTEFDLRTRHDNRLGDSHSQLSWPSELVQPRSLAIPETYIGDCMAIAERVRQGWKDNEDLRR